MHRPHRRLILGAALGIVAILSHGGWSTAVTPTTHATAKASSSHALDHRRDIPAAPTRI